MKARILTFTACTLVAMNASAAPDFSGCDVLRVIATGEQNGHVHLSCQVSNLPACATANQFVAFDRSTTTGKHYMAMFMSAQAMGGKVEGNIDRASCAPWQSNVGVLTYLSVTK